MKPSTSTLAAVIARLKTTRRTRQWRIDRASVWGFSQPKPMKSEQRQEQPRTLVERGERLRKNGYIISGDIGERLKQWAARKKFVIPPRILAEYQRSVSVAASRAFSGTDVTVTAIDEATAARRACAALREMARSIESPVAVIALDPLFERLSPKYKLPTLSLSLTRLAGADGQSLNALGERPRTEPLARQIAKIVATLRASRTTQVLLADDVMFSGSQMVAVKAMLESQGLVVVGMYASIATDDSFKKIEQDSSSKPLSVVFSYSGDVLDIIDARDFLPGAADGGRTIAGVSDTGMPYLLPFGQPVRWASIPEDRAKKFSRELLCAALALYEKIETASNTQLLLKDLPRGVFTPSLQENTASSSERVVVWLRGVLQRL